MEGREATYAVAEEATPSACWSASSATCIPRTLHDCAIVCRKRDTIIQTEQTVPCRQVVITLRAGTPDPLLSPGRLAERDVPGALAPGPANYRGGIT